MSLGTNQPINHDRRAGRFGRLFLMYMVTLVAGGDALAGNALSDLLGRTGHHRVVQSETLHDIALQEDLGFIELLAANPGVDPWLPRVGTDLVLPAAHILPEGPRDGIVINLADQRLYYFARGGNGVMTFPIGTGRAGWETPTGETWVAGKRENPTWIPPASIRAERPDLPAAIPPGPGNPLGDHTLDLAWEGFVIHGTNRTLGIGRRVSHGCLRLHPADIKILFDAVPIGTRVRIVDQAVKIGWLAEALYLEIHPTQSQADEIEATGRFTPEPIQDLLPRLHAAGDQGAAAIDWDLVAQTAKERRGVPVRITP